MFLMLRCSDLSAHPEHGGELELLEERGLPELRQGEVRPDPFILHSLRPAHSQSAVQGSQSEHASYFLSLSLRSVESKPARPSRKRAAPEEFLGKGPDRKIFMGK